MLIRILSVAFFLPTKVIPDYTAAKVMYRATSVKDHTKLQASLMKILNAAAESTGCTVKITEEMQYKPVLTNEILANRYADYTEQLGVKYPPRAVQEAAPSGSTDMGNVAYHVPGIHPVFNIASLDGVIDPSISNHSIGFTAQAKTEVAHSATLRSAKGLALTGLDVLLEDGFAEAAKRNFDENASKEGVSHIAQKLKALAIPGGCGCH